MSDNRASISAYTDGACSGNPGPGGYGIVIVDNDNVLGEYKGSEPYTTNNRMELTAVIKALDYMIADYSEDLKGIHIVSDSQYVVDAINKGWLKKWTWNGYKTKKGSGVKNKDLWESLDVYLQELKRRNIKIWFVKVKGHDGNPLNERADDLAVQACNEV